jgi:hypothetical protein
MLPGALVWFGSRQHLHCLQNLKSDLSCVGNFGQSKTQTNDSQNGYIMNRTFPISSPTLPSHIAYPIDLAEAVRFGPNLPLAFFKASHIFHGDVHVRMTKGCQQPQEP